VLLVVGIEALVNLVASILFAKAFGYIGVGLGTLVAYALCDFIPIQLLSARVVAEQDKSEEKAPLWTRELSALVVSIVVALLIYRAGEAFPMRPSVRALVTGVASVATSITIMRLVGGAGAWTVFKSVAARLRPKKALG
jgi:hypothetical protein